MNIEKPQALQLFTNFEMSNYKDDAIKRTHGSMKTPGKFMIQEGVQRKRRNVDSYPRSEDSTRNNPREKYVDLYGKKAPHPAGHMRFAVVDI